MTSDSHLTEPDAAAPLLSQLPGGPEPAVTSALITLRSPTAAEVNDVEQLAISVPWRGGSFAALLRACRHRAWLSQEQLAALANVSERTVRELEAGRVRSPRAETVRLLADALQLTGPERASWFSAGAGVNDQLAGPPAAVGVDSPARPSDAPSRQPPTPRPWRGPQSTVPQLSAEGSDAEVAGTGSDARLSSAERRELARLRRENRTLREDVEILKRAAAIFAAATR